MKRPGEIARHTELRRRKPVNPRNQERREREHARCYGEHAEWIRTLPPILPRWPGDRTRVVAAHVKGGGVGRKADARWLVPLTYRQHQVMHTLGQASFEVEFNVFLEATAMRLWERSPYREAA